MKIFLPKTKSCPNLREDQKKEKKRSSLKFSAVFGPKLGEDQKQKQKKTKRSPLKFSLVLGPKLGEDQKKKVFTQIKSGFWPKERSSPTASVLKSSAQVTTGRAMPQFYILFYDNYTILATQRGGMAKWPPKYAPANALPLDELACRELFFNRNITRRIAAFSSYEKLKAISMTQTCVFNLVSMNRVFHSRLATNFRSMIGEFRFSSKGFEN